MTWSRKLAKPIALKDGRTISTLGEAHETMRSPPSGTAGEFSLLGQFECGELR